MMSSSESQLVQKLREAWPPVAWCDVTVLVAVSGGADSVALARGLTESRSSGDGRLVIAHYDHRLRGAESDADQAFVVDLAKSLGCEIVVGSAEKSNSLTSEGSAREARYAFLAVAAARFGARYVATAHTVDDQVETVLHNVIRGTGLAGLAGIPRFRRLTEATSVVRPLLNATRAEVVDYLQQLGQPFREDSTNASAHFTRNRIRHELLPLLEREYNADVRQSLLRLAQIAEQTDAFLDHEAHARLETAVNHIPNGVEIRKDAVAGVHEVVVRQMLLLIWQQQQWPLQDMSLEKWEQLVQLALSASTTTTANLPGAVRAVRSGAWLRLTRLT